MQQAERQNNKVSIIIPTYNSEATIERTLESVLQQTYQNIEIIVVDNGSTDDTIRLVQELESVLLFTLDRVERSVARNVGVNQSSGDYILFLDSDDAMLFDSIEYLVSTLELNPSCFAIKGESEFCFDNGVPFSEISRNKNSSVIESIIQSSEQLFTNCSYPISSILIKRNDALFPPGLSICEDWVYWINALKGKDVIVSNKIVCKIYRHHDNSTNDEFYLLLGELLVIHKYNICPVVSYGTGRRFGKLFANYVKISFINPIGFFHFFSGLICGFFVFFAKSILRK